MGGAVRFVVFIWRWSPMECLPTIGALPGGGSMGNIAGSVSLWEFLAWETVWFLWAVDLDISIKNIQLENVNYF